MLLYHGTTIFNALSILNNGFSFNYSGTNWGSTYGKAIYFSPNYNTAKFYAGNDGIVLSFNFFIDDFYVLPFFQSPNKKFKIKYHSKWIISKDYDEYILRYYK